MKVQFYKTKNKILEKYIFGYYFIEKQPIEKTIKYWTFPNNFYIAAVYKNTELMLENNKISVSSSEKSNIISSLVSRYISPIEIIQNAITDEITIYFKPLGLNYFLEDYDKYLQKDIMFFNPFSDYEIEMDKVFNTENRDLQIQMLEEYWLSKLRNIDLTLIEDILNNISETDMKLQEIAEKYNITRQYLNKFFTKHLGKSPSEFRKIQRFRNSINQTDKKSFTELCFDNLFYDQSHFIKDFKNFTTTKPSAFFKKVDTEKENIWMFLS